MSNKSSSIVLAEAVKEVSSANSLIEKKSED